MRGVREGVWVLLAPGRVVLQISLVLFSWGGGEQRERRVRSAGRAGPGVRGFDRGQSLGGCGEEGARSCPQGHPLRGRQSFRSIPLPWWVSVTNTPCRASGGTLRGAYTVGDSH